MLPILALASVVLLATAPAPAPAPADAVVSPEAGALRATALDYIEGYYTGDGSRMERALHPELAKRIVYTDGPGQNTLSQMSAMTLVNATRAGYGKNIRRRRGTRRSRSWTLTRTPLSSGSSRPTGSIISRWRSGTEAGGSSTFSGS